MADLKNVVADSFTRYAGNVILDRAICDVRDMLKPAARMLTYSQLHITKNGPDKPFVKSARVVGDALGHYYTHGDSSCYGTYMRMAKPFAMRYPIEDCQGNSGTIAAAGDEAASRYTELRLSKIGSYLFKDIDKDLISWLDNFDETDKYPNVLPSKGFYNIVNGTTGIGVSLSSSIPQFNLREVNNVLINLLRNPEIDDKNVIIMPDFATGGILLNGAEVQESLKEGQGKSCILRAVIEYDAKGNLFKVKELPYGVYTNTITEQIQNLLEKNPECGIDGINDGSGKTPDYIIYLSKGANPTQVLQTLYKETSLQTFFTINMTVLKDGRFPKIMGLREMFLEYLEHQKLMYRRTFEYDKRKLEDRLHIIDGLLICLAHIEEVIAVIKGSNSVADAAAQLQTKFLLDAVQAKAILDMKLSRLAHLEVEKLEQEKKDLQTKLEWINKVLNDQKLLNEEIIKDLKEVSNKFGDGRRTKIENIVNTTEEDKETIVEKPESLFIYVTSENKIKSLKVNDMATTGKGTKGTLLSNKLIAACGAMSNSLIGLVNTDNEIKFIDAKILTPNIDIDINSIWPNSVVKYVFEYIKTKYLVVATKGGYIKKTLLSDYNTSKVQVGFKLKPEDTIVSVKCCGDNEYFAYINNLNKVVMIPTDEIKISGRVTYGSKVSSNEILNFDTLAAKDKVLLYDNDNKGKICDVSSIPVTTKGSTGSNASDGTCGICKVGNEFVFISTDGRIIKLNSSTIAEHSFKAIGSKLMNNQIFKIVKC